MGRVEPHEVFARNLRAARTKRGLSQEALGAAAGLHRTEIGLLERGERDPRLATITKLARALRTTTAALVEGVK